MYQAKRQAIRDHAIRLGLTDYDLRRYMRAVSTYERLSEAACNGDYPCDNGQRAVVFCSRCEGGMVPSKTVKGICESCRVEDRIRAIVSEYPDLTVSFSGDPRGWTVHLEKRDAS